MCLMVFAIGARPDLPFVFAANRDEFYRRPTQAASYWKAGEVELWGGRDLEAGGTWLALAPGSGDGRFAALTNYRDPRLPKGERSRGSLVRGFFQSGLSPEAYLAQVSAEISHYQPFNLLVGKLGSPGEAPELWYLASVSQEEPKYRRLGPGLYGLSNATLDVPWPKVTRSKRALAGILDGQGPAEALEERLFQLLRDPTRVADAELPNTGVPLEWERVLSSIFIETTDYGTRSSTVILKSGAEAPRFSERVYR